MKPTKTTEQEKFYVSSDLAIITLLSLSYPIEEIDKSNPRKAQFSFRRNEKLDELVEKYWRGELKVEPSQFFNQLRIVKARLYGEE
jgi:hypothetical protein